MALEHEELTEQIIGAAFEVMNELGSGFLEKVYENALVVELRSRGVTVETQKRVEVYYKGHLVGDYVADVLVENTVLVELKVVRGLDDVHMAQCINYLKATKLHLCLLFNFGVPRLQFKRVVYEL